MSAIVKRIIGKHIPLWKRKIPPYPIYWQGDPQLRIFLPLFWIKLLKPKKPIPNDRVHLEIHPQMSKIDVKNYLEKIYKVPILDVRTRVQQGKDIKHPSRGHVVNREDDKKFAYVILGGDQTFIFPDVLAKQSETDRQLEEFKQATNANERVKQKYWDRLSLPPWFR